MAFRTLELSKPCEIHINKNQLKISQEEQTIYIPINDIFQIICIGPNIRLSTMDISILSNHKINLVTLNNKYLPTAMVMPTKGNSRQAKIVKKQVSYSNEKYMNL